MPKYDEKVFMVTDQELAFRNTISDNFPNVTLLRCWNHLFKNVGDWLDKRNSRQDERQYYIKEVRELINCESREAYEKLKLKKQKNWADAFSQYFNAYIGRDIEQLARWTLESFNVYNPFSGITTNTSEELEQDASSSDKLDFDDLISTGLAEKLERSSFDPEITSTQNDNTDSSASKNDKSNESTSILSIVKSVNSNNQTNESSNRTILKPNFIRAENLAPTVEYLKDKDRYVVSNGKKDSYLVNLNNLTCTCIAKKLCVHIMAVQLNIGIFIQFCIQKSIDIRFFLGVPVAAAKTVTLTTLQKNKRHNLRGGRKYRDNEPQYDIPLLKDAINIVPNCIVCKLDQVKYKPCKLCPKVQNG